MTLLELTESEIAAFLDPALKSIPPPIKILQESIDSLPFKKLEPDYVKNHFSEVMELVTDNAFAKFKAYQKMASKPVIQKFMDKYGPEIEANTKNQKEFVSELLDVFMPVAVSFEFRTSQMRKSRAGNTFEHITVFLLRKCGIKCERTAMSVRKKMNRMDIVIPDQEVALKKPDQAKFLSCKHTLRERWKQALPEKNRNWVMYLITMDDDIPDQKAKEINDHNLIVYVRDQVKAKSYLAKKDWIRRLSDLPKDLK